MFKRSELLTPLASVIALWNSIESRIEMHLESTQAQIVDVVDAELHLHFLRGETIHTENSYKFTSEGHGKTATVGTPSRWLVSGSAEGKATSHILLWYWSVRSSNRLVPALLA